MMRAAHSIKGAARVVRVEAAVRVAHVMEDCFIEVRKGTLTLSPSDIDVLLRGVDLLGKISEATRSPDEDPASRFEEAVRSLVVEIGAILSGRGRPIGASPGPGADPALAPIAPTTVEPATTTTDETIAFPEFLDAAAAEELRLRFLSAAGRGCDPVRIDLRGTKDLDVQGLVLLATIPRHVARHGRPKIRLVGLSEEMEVVLRVTGMDADYGAGADPTPRGA
jgi:two-component system sensor histidine kinase and response regulator WspE